MRITFYVIAAAILLAGAPGCVEESSVPVAFDQELESATFDNRLYTPIAIFRDNQLLDTLPALQRRRYAINQKGIIRHAWKIVPARGENGRIAGVEPYVELGTQFDIRAEYIITNNSVPGEVLFTPRVANFSPYNLQLFANFREEDEFWTDYVIPRSGITDDTHAPYFYWNSRSNVYLEQVGRSAGYVFSRLDTGVFGLALDNSLRHREAGATLPITVR